MKLKTKIISLSLITMSTVFILWSDNIPFLSSSIVQASLSVPDLPGEILAHIRLEREELTLDKQEKIEEKKATEQIIKSLEQNASEKQRQLQDIQKSLDEVNTAIVSFPWPETTQIEALYVKKINEENIRYEKQKIADQKLYTDTIRLIDQTYDEKIRLYKGKDNLTLQDAESLANTNRKNALQSLTDIQVKNLEKHENLLQSIEEEKQHSIEKATLENNDRLVPLVHKKNDLSQKKIILQSELERVLAEESRSEVELEKIKNSIHTIEDDILALDYKILILEEDILKQIAP